MENEFPLLGSITCNNGDAANVSMEGGKNRKNKNKKRKTRKGRLIIPGSMRI